MAQYRALNAWHNGNDAKLKAARRDTNATAQIRSSLKALHEKFLSQLAENLTPEQVEQVKDKMTYGKVQFTYTGYLDQYPGLSETNKQEILAMLKEAREEAMDGGSAQEKTAVFQRYKGKINNYLSKQGIHPEKQKRQRPAPTFRRNDDSVDTCGRQPAMDGLNRIKSMAEWTSDSDLFQLCARELYTPVVGDILDDLGFTRQFLPQPIQPLREEMKLAGRAMPVVMIDVYGRQKKPFGLLTEALDQLEPGEIYLASGGDMRCAYWGEILTATAKARGAAGAIINGFHRDTPKVLEQNWPVFSRGRFAQDSGVRTQVVDYRCPVEIGQVSVLPGDLVFGDLDGVVIVPKKVEAEVIEKALAKARGEKLVRKEIEAGMSSTAAFKKYGIL